MRQIQNPDSDNVLVLYTYPKDEEMLPDVHIDLQVYSRGYNRARVLLDKCLPAEVTFYDLFDHTPILYDLPIADLDTMMLYVEDNDYLYAGGVWQVRPAQDQIRYELQCLCAAHISLVETVELLPTETIHPLDQVIFEASLFLQARFPLTRFVLLSSEKMDHGAATERQRSLAQEDVPGSAEEGTWRVVFQGFLLRKPEPTDYTVLVHYDPEKRDEPFRVEVA